MGVGQLSESDAVDALRLPFYSSSHPTGSHGWRNQFDLGNPDLGVTLSRLLDGRTLIGQTFNTAVSGDIIVLALLVAVAIGLFFGIYPAARAANLHPIEALRSE